MSAPFLIKLTSLLHWGRVFKTTLESNPDPLGAVKSRLFSTVLFLNFLGSPLNDKTWSNILLIQSVPVKITQPFKTF